MKMASLILLCLSALTAGGAEAPTAASGNVDVNALIGEVRARIKDDKLIEPAGDSAREALVALRYAAPNQPEVAELSREIASRLFEKSKATTRAHAYQRSAQLLRAARQLDDGTHQPELTQAEIDLNAALRKTPASRSSALTAADQAEIQLLYAKYNHAIDSGDAEEWAATFTPNGVFNERFAGREALIGFINTWKASGMIRRHWNNNLLISGDARAARGSVYLMLMNVGVRPAAILATGVYLDDLIKTDAGWRFERRVVKIDTPVAKPDAPTPDKPK
jgi:hypothetical protein